MNFEGPSQEEKKPGIFDEGYDSTGNENQETNLANYQELKSLETADEVRAYYQKQGVNIPLSEYDEGVIAYKDAQLAQLEGYLKRMGAIE